MPRARGSTPESSKSRSQNYITEAETHHQGPETMGQWKEIRVLANAVWISRVGVLSDGVRPTGMNERAFSSHLVELGG